MNFIFSLRSEFLKLKRTSVIYLVLIAAFIIPFVSLFDHDPPNQPNPLNGWDHFYIEGFRVFVFVFLPLFSVLASTLVMQIEIRNHTWKQVLASPQSFFHILLAKFIVIQVLVFALLVIYNIYMVMSATTVDLIYGLEFLTYLERWPELLKTNLMAYGATLGIGALGFWLALRSKNFIAPIAIGFLLWLIVLAAFELKWTHADKYLFALPFTIVSKRSESDPVFHQLLSMGYGIIFFGATYLEFVLKRVSLRLFWPRKKLD